MKIKSIVPHVFVFLVFLFAGTLGATAAEKPNVIIIFADDLGWGDLGCYGQTNYTTPHLDRMAAEGARLTDFYSTCPYCAPSRAALLTGRYQFRSGMTKNPAPDENKNDFGLRKDELTLGELFQKAGYRTCCVGKWHLGHKPEFFPTKNGFHEYLGILYSHDMRPVQVMDGNKVVEYPVVIANLTKKYTERGLRFIEQNKNKPFFLYMPHPLPHKPLAASEDFYKKSGGGLYGDAMMELDRSVGEILKKLKELNLDEKTLVFFSSDNGPWYGGSSGGLRGMKGTQWDGGIRVPMIARWPGKIPAGHVSRQPAVMMDLFSTALIASGVEIPQDRIIDGKNIMPLLTSNTKTPHDAIFSMANDQMKTVRSGKWKLHGVTPNQTKIVKTENWVDKRAPDGVTIIAPFEQANPSQYPGVITGDEAKAGSLFDLENDPAEQNDVSSAHPEIAKKLQALFDQMQAEAKAAPTQTK